MLRGIAFAIFAGAFANLGVFLQKLALDSRPAGSSIARAFLTRRWLAGMLLVQIGALAQLLALRTIPLFVVQPIAASGIVVLVVLARKRLREPVDLPVAVAIAAVVVGGSLLALASTSVAGAPHQNEGSALAGLIAVAAVLPATAGTALAFSGRARLGGLSASAGVCYGMAIAMSKPIAATLDAGVLKAASRSLGEPYIYLVAAFSLVGAWFNQVALAEGRASVVAPTILGIMTVVPVLAGLTLFGERLPAWPAQAGVWTGITASLVGVVWLASVAEAKADDTGSRATESMTAGSFGTEPTGTDPEPTPDPTP